MSAFKQQHRNPATLTVTFHFFRLGDNCRSQSHTRIPQRERMATGGGLDITAAASPAPPQSVDSAGLLLSTTTNSVSSPPSSMRHPTTNAATLAMMQTKTVELDPQPNNVNAELGCF